MKLMALYIKSQLDNTGRHSERREESRLAAIQNRRLQFAATAAFLFLFLFHCVAFTAGKDDPEFEVSATKFLLGAKVDILARHASIGEARKACYFAFREIERIENLLSAHLESSEITKINRNSGRAPVKVSRETFVLLQRGMDYSQRFRGLFDLTIGPLTALWGFNSEREIAIPDLDRLVAARNLVDFCKIQLSEQDTTVLLVEKGMALDLGGMAKGYAIDRAAAVLKENGVDHFLINAGGDIYAAGRKSIERNWLVGVKHPRQQNALFAKMALQDLAIATSGDYERYAMIDGKRYHHLLDPVSGFPANKCQSVTVLAQTAEEADVWATYLFILGYEQRRKRFESTSVRAIIVDAKGEVHYDATLWKNYGLELFQ